MSTEKIFEPHVQIQRFRNTAPPQVRQMLFEVPYEGIAYFKNALKEYHEERKEKSLATEDSSTAISAPTVSLSEGKKREQQELLRQQAVVAYEARKTSAGQHFGDPYCTVFMAHLPPETTESDIAAAVSAVLANSSAPHVTLIHRQHRRSYAFVTLTNRTDARQLLSVGTRFEVLGRRVVVDVERGRIVKNWLPKRLRKR